MRITDIELKNYRAFYGTHHINLGADGKNLMLYGENGSGKSSLFTALQQFFRSSVGEVEVEENIFVPASKRNSSSIKITVKESPKSSGEITYELSCVNNRLIGTDAIYIADANKIKGFFDYRSLLNTHFNHLERVNLFEILVENILYHSTNEFSKEEIGKEWQKIYDDTFNKKQTSKLKNQTITYLKEKFSPGLKRLLSSIEADTNMFLDYFGLDVKVSFDFEEVFYHGRKSFSGNEINLKIDYCGKPISKHHKFLNEARLSALAICIYLASIKINPSDENTLKILVLDDILIGLDMSNRLPLLNILKDHFEKDFQVILTTYDKVWFELVRNYFGEDNWKFVEVYAKKLGDDDFEIPVVKNTDGYLTQAQDYLDQKDYKASAVYIRTEFERLVKKICEDKSLSVIYKSNQKKLKSDDFWTAIKEQTDIGEELVKEIEIHRGTVMNPFCHYDLEKPEFKKELEKTIEAVGKLKDLTRNKTKALNKTVTIKKLRDEIKKLEEKIKKKDKTIEQIKKRIANCKKENK